MGAQLGPGSERRRGPVMEGGARAGQRKTRAGKDPEGALSLAGSQWSDDVTGVTLGSPLTGRFLKGAGAGGGIPTRRVEPGSHTGTTRAGYSQSAGFRLVGLLHVHLCGRVVCAESAEHRSFWLREGGGTESSVQALSRRRRALAVGSLQGFMGRAGQASGVHPSGCTHACSSWGSCEMHHLLQGWAGGGTMLWSSEDVARGRAGEGPQWPGQEKHHW